MTTLPVELSTLPKAAAVSAINKRHGDWLGTGDSGPQAKRRKLGWRLRKKYPVSVLKWILRVHNQLRLSTAFGGLLAIQYAPSLSIWAPSNWRRWPGLASVQDQGTDGTSAIRALKYFKQCNIWEWWDFSHGACMDLKLGLQAVGLWPLVLLLMVVHNLGHGPEGDAG